jgi:hypothetical protein
VPGHSAPDPASTPRAETARGPTRPGLAHWRTPETPRSGSAPHGLPCHSIAGPRPRNASPL